MSVRGPLLAVVIAVSLVFASCDGRSPVEPSPTPGQPVPTPPVIISGPPQVFVGAGDIANCDGNADATSRLLDSIGGLVFALGDIAYPHGTRDQFRDCYNPTWGRHRGRTRPVPGNHEYDTENGAPYYEYFGALAGPAGLGYYSFDLGAWHIIALNSNIDMDRNSAQWAWLRQDLAVHPMPCTLAYWHHPLFSSGEYGDAPFTRDAWELLHLAGADVILNGHAHLYERFARQDPDGQFNGETGIRQFVVGTGGAPLKGRERFKANSEVVLTTFGVLKLTLRGGGYDWEFVSVSGPSDSGSDLCH